MGAGKVSDADFESEVLKASGPVVVDFWAQWCAPCRQMAPALDEVSGILDGKVKVLKVDIDQNPRYAEKFGVMSIPTLMIFKNGEIAARHSGSIPDKQKLEQWITSSV